MTSTESARFVKTYLAQMLLSASFEQFLPLFKTDSFLYYQHGIFHRTEEEYFITGKKGNC